MKGLQTTNESDMCNSFCHQSGEETAYQRVIDLLEDSNKH